MKLRTKLNNGLPDIVADLTPLEDKIKADAIVPTKVEYGAGLDGLPEIGKNKVKITLSDGTELVSDEVLDIFPTQLTLSKDGKTLTILLSDGTTIDENVGVLLDNLYNADGDIIEPRTVEMTNLLTWVGKGGMDIDTPITFKNKVLDYTGTECTIGQKLIGAINGMVQWIDDDGINYADLGTGIDIGTLESNKINPTRWDNTIEAGDLPTDGQVPDGKNKVTAYNGNWKSDIILPTTGNFVGEVFIVRNVATNRITVSTDNTTLPAPLVISGGEGALTAVWNGSVWDVVTTTAEGAIEDTRLLGFNYPKTEATLLNDFEHYSTWDATYENCYYEVKGNVLYISGTIHKGHTDKVVFTLPAEISEHIDKTHPIGVGEKTGSSGRVNVLANGDVVADDYDGAMTSMSIQIPLSISNEYEPISVRIKANASFCPADMSTEGSTFYDLILGTPEELEGLTLDEDTNEVITDRAMVLTITADLRLKVGESNQNAFRFYKNGSIVNGSTNLEPNSDVFFMSSKTKQLKLVAGDRIKIGIKGELSVSTYNSVTFTEV